ncbi:MAG: Holliday junction branch migration protein RuvA [Muribaculaceae bacterium]|nr:Holliday junction branch migration protein RuvA [Muribaculaceae bacterium]
MIEYVKGKLDQLTPATAVIETAGGVAYMLSISLPTYAALEGKSEAKLLVHESIREDAWVLFGFATERERELFRALVSVSGVGSGTARVILSSMQPEELAAAIASGDEKRLKAVKGIGAKTAQRIIVDLRGKIAEAEPLESSDSMGMAYDDALAALMALGYQRAACNKVLKALFEKNPTMKADEAIRKSFAML